MPNIQVKAVPLPYATPRVTPGQSYDWVGGPQAEGLISQLHDRFYQQTYNGNMFVASLTTAAAIPINTTTSGVTLCLWNPLGSGVQIVPVAFIIGYTGTTGVAGATGYYYASNTGAQVGTGSTITAFTAITINNGVLGVTHSDGSLPVRAGSAATIAAAGTLNRWSIFSEATPATNGTGGPYTLLDNNFQGSMGVRPGTLLYAAATAATGATFMQSFVFYLTPWP